MDKSEGQTPLGKRWHKRVMSWVHALWVSDWTVTTVLMDPDEYNEGRNTEASEFPSVAYTNSSPRYQLAHIVANRDLIRSAERYDKEEFDRVACHEVVHVVLSQLDSFIGNLIDGLPRPNQGILRQQWSDEMEATTSHLERALTHMRSYNDHLETEFKKQLKAIKTKTGYVKIQGTFNPARQTRGRPSK